MPHQKFFSDPPHKKECGKGKEGSSFVPNPKSLSGSGFYFCNVLYAPLPYSPSKKMRNPPFIQAHHFLLPSHSFPIFCPLSFVFYKISIYPIFQSFWKIKIKFFYQSILYLHIQIHIFLFLFVFPKNKNHPITLCCKIIDVFRN